MKRGKEELLFADHLSIHIRSQISLKDLKALKIQISSQDQDSEKKKKINSQPFLCIKTYLLDLKYKVYLEQRFPEKSG